MLLFTSIQHTFRRKYSLNLIEYTICDTIYHLSNNKNGKVAGWCYASKSYLGEEIGCTRQTISIIINKMIAKGFLKMHRNKRFVQTTALWDKVYLLSINQLTQNKETGVFEDLENAYSPKLVEEINELIVETENNKNKIENGICPDCEIEKEDFDNLGENNESLEANLEIEEDEIKLSNDNPENIPDYLETRTPKKSKNPKQIVKKQKKGTSNKPQKSYFCQTILPIPRKNLSKNEQNFCSDFGVDNSFLPSSKIVKKPNAIIYIRNISIYKFNYNNDISITSYTNNCVRSSKCGINNFSKLFIPEQNLKKLNSENLENLKKIEKEKKEKENDFFSEQIQAKIQNYEKIDGNPLGYLAVCSKFLGVEYENQPDKFKDIYSKDIYFQYIRFLNLFKSYKLELLKPKFILINEFKEKFYKKVNFSQIEVGIKRMIALGVNLNMNLALRLLFCIDISKNNFNAQNTALKSLNQLTECPDDLKEEFKAVQSFK